VAARSSESTEIAVIGAGVMGTSTAYHLALRGAGVLLIDKLGAAGGPSGASAGMLRAHYEDPAIVAVARYGCEFLADMLARTGSDPGFVNCGYLAVGEADREPRIRRAIEVMRAQGVTVEHLDNAQIRALEPRLAAEALTIGAYEPTNGVCEPLFVADGFAQAAERLGARLAFGARVTAVRPDGEGFLLTTADGRRISAERVAVCCGGFGPRLTRSLGGSLPVDLVRVQAGRFRPPFPFGPPGPIVSHHSLGIWLRPDGDDGHYLVGARADFLGRGPYRARSGQGGADLRELERLSGLVARVFPGAARGIFRGSWASWLDFTPDGNPVVDLVPRRPGLLLASGMSGHAFKLCPALGLGAAELLLDGEVRSFDWTPFRYGRFDRGSATPGARSARMGSDPHRAGQTPSVRTRGAGGSGTG
jgi:glycine/D-amino acid oxidase-like deaminating enzyme